MDYIAKEIQCYIGAVRDSEQEEDTVSAQLYQDEVLCLQGHPRVWNLTRSNGGLHTGVAWLWGTFGHTM